MGCPRLRHVWPKLSLLGWLGRERWLCHQKETQKEKASSLMSTLWTQIPKRSSTSTSSVTHLQHRTQMDCKALQTWDSVPHPKLHTYRTIPSLYDVSSPSSDYSSSFPPLETHTDSQRNVVSKPFESVLNWQTQNARAQNDTLLQINSKVENISLRTEQIETKVDSITAQMQ